MSLILFSLSYIFMSFFSFIKYTGFVINLFHVANEHVLTNVNVTTLKSLSNQRWLAAAKQIQ